MKLSKLCSEFEYTLLQGEIAVDISDIKYNSKDVSEGDAFVCITGMHYDGHEYVKEAAANGAAAVLLLSLIHI